MILRINADNFTVKVDQGTAAVAWIDGSIRLDHATNGELCQTTDGAVKRADDARGQCPALPERAANSQHRMGD